MKIFHPASGRKVLAPGTFHAVKLPVNLDAGNTAYFERAAAAGDGEIRDTSRQPAPKVTTPPPSDKRK